MLEEYRTEAQTRLDELPARVAAEKKAAAEEHRKPFNIVPLVEVDPAVLGPFLAEVGTGKVPDAIAETYGTVVRVCKQQPQKFAMRAGQLLELLKLKKADK
jgi:hypothetical protein